MSFLKCKIILIFLGILFRVCLVYSFANIHDADLTQINMNDYCGISHTVEADAILVQYRTIKYHANCQTALKPKNSKDRFLVKVLKSDFRETLCANNYMKLQDGFHKGPLLYTLCGHFVPSGGSYATTGSWLSLSYENTGAQLEYPFQLLITTYRDGDCDKNTQFACDNGKCIAQTLVCNGWDNCGDGSDETRACAQYPSVRMDTMCNVPYKLTNPAIQLKYQVDSSHDSCHFILNTNGDNLIVKPLVVDFENIVCASDNVTVRNGNGVVLGTNCQTVVPHSAFFTLTPSLTLDYVSTTEQDIFQFIITQYTTEWSCNATGKFKCDNGLCISSSLRCDGWNNCDDDSDETGDCPRPDTGLSAGAIAGIVLGAVISFIVIICVVVVFLRRKRKRSSVPAQGKGTPYGSIRPEDTESPARSSKERSENETNSETTSLNQPSAVGESDQNTGLLETKR